MTAALALPPLTADAFEGTFSRATGTLIRRYGAARADLIAWLRFRTGAESLASYERDGYRWWRGPARVVGDEVGVTGKQARYHLDRLMAEGIVVGEFHQLRGPYDRAISYRLAVVPSTGGNASPEPGEPHVPTLGNAPIKNPQDQELNPPYVPPLRQTEHQYAADAAGEGEDPMMLDEPAPERPPRRRSPHTARTAKRAARRAEEGVLFDLAPEPAPRGELARSEFGRTIARRAADDAAFAEWWAVWPRKVKRPEAREAWPAAVAAVGVDALMAAARRWAWYVSLDPVRHKRATPYPATWLHNERWEDDVTALWRSPRGDTEFDRQAAAYDPVEIANRERLAREREEREARREAAEARRRANDGWSEYHARRGEERPD